MDKIYQFKGLLQSNKWVCPAFVTVSDSGLIKSISNTNHSNIQVTEVFDALVIPGFQNAHSHAFQYAMAGLAETHTTTETPDDFWSWRESMYQLALSISPDQLEAIATQLYAEMLRHGYTHVAEFHYVHHDKNGQKFNHLSEMGERLISAAKTAGIGITLVPIFYQKGGFGQTPKASQKRFISNTFDDYMKLYEASVKSAELYQKANVGVGIHSMRAVSTEDIIQLAEKGPQNLPFHIHVSEQLKEIEDSIQYLGQRPVEWLLNHLELSDRFHLVHATHLVDEEVKGIAKSKANVVLCPSTEGNLGDGIFPLKKFQDYGGSWSIGTDSHVGLNPFEELRILDYGQRLVSHKRNIFYSNQQGNSGAYAIEMSVISGRKAMNQFSTTYFDLGEPFDAVLVDSNHPLMALTSQENWLNTILYSSDSKMIIGTFTNGKLVVRNQTHYLKNSISNTFIQTIKQLHNR